MQKSRMWCLDHTGIWRIRQVDLPAITIDCRPRLEAPGRRFFAPYDRNLLAPAIEVRKNQQAMI
jgi:hypothetical protein